MRGETAAALEQAIQDYHEWMAVNGYAKSTQQGHQCTLRYFRLFIDINRYHWDDIFTRRTLNRFKKARREAPCPCRNRPVAVSLCPGENRPTDTGPQSLTRFAGHL